MNRMSDTKTGYNYKRMYRLTQLVKEKLLSAESDRNTGALHLKSRRKTSSTVI